MKKEKKIFDFLFHCKIKFNFDEKFGVLVSVLKIIKNIVKKLLFQIIRNFSQFHNNYYDRKYLSTPQFFHHKNYGFKITFIFIQKNKIIIQ